jgi:small subunit ribosomal protein S19
MSRSKWKGPYVNTEILENLIKSEKTESLVASRNSKIIPKFLNLTFKVYNGKSFTELVVTKEMINHKFGEFVFTRSKFVFKKKNQKKKKSKKK